MWTSYEAEGGERGRGEQVTSRGSEVLCLRHGSRLREAGEGTQHGSVLSQETLVHPPQALDPSQGRESLHRGGERYRQAQTDSMQGGPGRVPREGRTPSQTGQDTPRPRDKTDSEETSAPQGRKSSSSQEIETFVLVKHVVRRCHHTATNSASSPT